MRTFAILAICIGLAAGGCVYEGRTYQQGQTWKKGCQYNCVCKDGNSGLYQCTDICPTYSDVPPQCTLVKQAGQCCSKPNCNFQPVGGSSSGSGTGTFTGSGSGSTGSMSGSCTDKLTNCKDYGTSVCTNTNYAKWVQDNCCAYCRSNGGSMGGSGTMTGGTMTGGTGTGSMTGGTSGTSGGTSGSGEPFQLVLGGGSGTGTGGSSSCSGDTINNCKDYGTSVCSDQNYAQWVQTHCCAFCQNGGSMTGTGTGMTGTGMTGTGTGMTGTGTGMTGTGMTGTGTGMTGGTCSDKIPNCSQYGQATCTNPSYTQWVSNNCPKYCNKCSGGMTGGMTGTGTGTGGFTGTGTGTGMTGTGTGMTGTGTGMTGTGTGMTGGMTGGACADAISNCAAYGKATCSNPDYSQWVTKNCNKYCGRCSGGMTSGGTFTGTGSMTGTGTGTGTGMTGTGTGGTGTGSGSGFSGSSSGCVYKGQIYQQGQTFKDGCQFKCTCTDGKTGRYSCTSLCITWQLPKSCTLNPPAAGKCCSTPNCPPSVNLQYPPGYVAE